MPEQEPLPIEPELDELRQRLFSDYQDYRRQCPEDKVSLDTWLVEAIRTRDAIIQGLERWKVRAIALEPNLGLLALDAELTEDDVAAADRLLASLPPEELS